MNTSPVKESLPEVAQHVHAAIMNIPCNVPKDANVGQSLAYKLGHRNARHAAAEIALQAIAAPREGWQPTTKAPRVGQFIPGFTAQESADFFDTHELGFAEAAIDERDQENEYVIQRMGQLLASVAVALKGPEQRLHRHGYDELPELAQKLMLELELHRVVRGAK